MPLTPPTVLNVHGTFLNQLKPHFFGFINLMTEVIELTPSNPSSAPRVFIQFRPMGNTKFLGMAKGPTREGEFLDRVMC